MAPEIAALLGFYVGGALATWGWLEPEDWHADRRVCVCGGVVWPFAPLLLLAIRIYERRR